MRVLSNSFSVGVVGDGLPLGGVLVLVRLGCGEGLEETVGACGSSLGEQGSPPSVVAPVLRASPRETSLAPHLHNQRFKTSCFFSDLSARSG